MGKFMKQGVKIAGKKNSYFFQINLNETIQSLGKACFIKINQEINFELYLYMVFCLFEYILIASNIIEKILSNVAQTLLTNNSKKF